MKIAYLIPFLMLTACGGSSKAIQNSIKEQLKDPDSVKFDKIIALKDIGCAIYNAKNGFGGYHGNHVAILHGIGTIWVVDEMESKSMCDEPSMKLMEEQNAAAYRADVDFTLKINSFRSEAHQVIIPEEIKNSACRRIAFQYRDIAKRIVGMNSSDPRKANEEAQMKEILDSVNDSNCQT